MEFFAWPAAIIPCLVVIAFHVLMDKHVEPPRALASAFGIGLLVVLCVLLLFRIPPLQDVENIFLHPVASGLWVAFAIAALPEEGFKWLLLRSYCRRQRAFDEPMDGIVYGVTVSMGFAAVENVFYIVGQSNWHEVAIVRAYMSIPLHASAGAIMGYFLAKHWFTRGGNRLALWMSILAPIALHGAYDTPLLITRQAVKLGLQPNAYGGALLSYMIVIVGSFSTLGLVVAARKAQERGRVAT